MIEFRLLDPGLVENSTSAEHCVHACYQMIFRTHHGAEVPSFETLDKVMNKVPGKYTFDYNLIAKMPKMGFEIIIVWQFDLKKLAKDPANLFLDVYGEEVGRITIDNTDLNLVSKDALALSNTKEVKIEERPATIEDIKYLLSKGFYILCTINQRILQADPGYVAHSILLFGYNDRGVIIHNPGPPSNAAAEIPWDLFDKSWACPDYKARNVMAFK